MQHNYRLTSPTFVSVFFLLAGEGLKAGDGAAQDESMDVVCAFVRVDGLEVHDVPDDVVLVADAVAAQHVAALAGDVQRLAARVALQQGDHLGRGFPLILEASDLQAAHEAQGDLGEGVGHLLLDQLVGCQGPAELSPVEGVLPGGVQAELCGAQRAPRDAEAGVVQAAERALEPLDAGQHVCLGHDHVVHEDHARGGGAQGELALDLGAREARHALLQDEPADLIIFATFRPDHTNISNWRIGDPSFGSVQDVYIVRRFVACVGLHASRVTAMVGLSEAEAADDITTGKSGEIFLTLLFCAEVPNGVHHKGRLNRHG